jgi:flagellar biogenesis protein FliO
MKKIILFVIFYAFVLLAQGREREFDMSQLNESMGNIVAQDSVTGNTSGDNQDGIGIIILRIVGSLALVLAIVGTAAWGIRKTGLLKNAVTAANQTPSMSVLEALSTGQGGVILLLRCEEQVFLVGQTPAKYTFLQELREDVAKKIIESKGGMETIGTFKDSLANFMQNMKNQKSENL